MHIVSREGKQKRMLRSDTLMSSCYEADQETLWEATSENLLSKL